MTRELSASERLESPGYRNLQVGWWTLLVFVCLGVLLELNLSFRSHFYMDASQHMRRLMWRLAHAHGTLLALLNIIFGIYACHLSRPGVPNQEFAASCLQSAGFLVPGGFFLAGLFAYQSTPGLATLLIPLGAILLVLGVLLTIRTHEK
ncbi:MAG: hypothetical protein VB877_10900 [Pirellulaceae bacterium]